MKVVLIVILLLGQVAPYKPQTNCLPAGWTTIQASELLFGILDRYVERSRVPKFSKMQRVSALSPSWACIRVRNENGLLGEMPPVTVFKIDEDDYFIVVLRFYLRNLKDGGQAPVRYIELIHLPSDRQPATFDVLVDFLGQKPELFDDTLVNKTYPHKEFLKDIRQLDNFLADKIEAKQ